MKKTFLFIMCGVMALTLVTGCGNEKQEKQSSSSSNNNVNDQSSSTGEIKNWNANRKGESLSNTDEQDGIVYRVEKMEDGDYILFFKNTNDYGINIFADLNFYNSESGLQSPMGSVRRTLACVKAGTIGAIVFNDITRSYDSYKMQFTVQQKEFEDGSTNISFKETEKDGKLKISGINNNEKDLSNFNATVVFYKNNKIVTAIHEDNGYGGLNVVKDYPKDKDGNKLDYDKYEIYLNSAYISQ